MPLAAGSRLGPYEILSALGAGGMGEVYRARDTRLERTVAIKVLNSQLVASAELRARFEREAKVISQLQHPHICVLHDVGSENGTEYLVMEFLEGESLSEKLKRGPLPTDELLKIAIQVADALNKAHKAGIIHRDLKPGNVMLTKSGAKLLDFGLAKPGAASAAATGSSSASIFAAAATMTSPASPLSSAGTVIGTVQYMAPEQIQGQEADERSDVFAFGVMLYEMATGKRAFEGKTQSSIVGQILAVDPPPISAVRPMTPPELSRLVATCLAKDPDERFQTIHDVKLRLQEIADTPASRGASSASSLVWPALALASLLALFAALGFFFTRKTPPPDVTSFQLDMGNLQIVMQAAGSRIAISPNGRTIVMMLHGENVRPQLFARRLDSLQLTAIAGSEGASQPFFSPDSRWVAFAAYGKLKKVLLSGGVPVTICAYQGTWASGTWGDNGTIIFDTSGASGLQIVSADGGTPQKLELGHELYRWPRYLPGSRALFASVRREGRFDIDLVHLDSHKTENLVQDGSWARYLSSGHILYAQFNSGGDSSGFTGGLLAFPFDLKGMKRTGPSEPALQGVMVGTGGAGFYDVSENGTIGYVPGGPEVEQMMDLTLLDTNGKVIPVGAPANHFHSLQLSPDGKLAAFALPLTTDIYTYDLSRKTTQRLTFDKHSQSPIFSPDGKHVFYSTNASGAQEIWSKAADGSGDAAKFLHSDFSPSPLSISPDGKTLAYGELHRDTQYDIYFASLHGEPMPHPFLNGKASEGQACFSPDGRFIAYASNESGENEVYVRSLQAGGGVWQVSNVDSRSPEWSRDGKKLYFVSEGSKLMVADVSSAGATFATGTPRRLFESIDFNHGGYAIAPDGRILFGLPTASTPRLNVLRVIEHFDSQLTHTSPATSQSQ